LPGEAGWRNRINAQYRNLHLARHHQKFDFVYAALTQPEVEWLLDEVFCGEEPGDLKGLLLLMLVLGVSVEQAVEARFALVRDKPRYDIEYVAQNNVFRIKAKKPEVRAPNKNTYQSVKSHISLPAPLGFNAYVGMPENEGNGGTPLFSIDAKTAEKDIKKLLRRQPEGFRISKERISSTLGFLVANHAGDHAFGALMLDKAMPHERTLRHYVAVPERLLVSAYQSALSQCGDERLLEARSCSDGYVGSSFLVKDDALSRWVTKLKTILESKPSGCQEIIQYHNVYARYTLMMLGHAMVSRGNHDPSPLYIDLKIGYAIVDDKMRRDGYNRRVNFLPDFVVEHLRFYAEHVKLIYAILNYGNVELGPLANLFFTINHQNRRELFSPRAMIDAVPTFPGKRNSLRHHMRSKLVQMGVGGDLIDAHMGHWHIGMEPFSFYSAMSPIMLKTELLPAVSKVMKSCGWEPVQSLVKHSAEPIGYA